MSGQERKLRDQCILHSRSLRLLNDKEITGAQRNYVLRLQQRVAEAQRTATVTMKDEQSRKRGGDDGSGGRGAKRDRGGGGGRRRK